MVTELRKKYNSEFTESAYEAFNNDLNSILRYPCDFRVCETPLFLSETLTRELVTACNDIMSQIRTPEFEIYSRNAIPEGLAVPNQDSHPKFLQIDFAITKDPQGNFIPKLIELQGFPSLYAFQYYLPLVIRRHFTIPDELTPYFSGFDDDAYISHLKHIIVGDADPENVILLEIEPDKQKTRIDFAATEELTGISTVCITKVKKQGRKLFYEKNGREIPVERIYNRVIYDELKRKGPDYGFRFVDEMDVTWVGHPNWFFKISKNTLPFLKSKYVPASSFLSEMQSYPDDLSQYILKPLYSFAGLGVEMNFDKARLDSITDRSNYILQEKIEYAPLIDTPDGFSRVEIRMMYLWDNEPLLVNNLVRTSKGAMMGVDFNKNKTWVGSSCAFHPAV
ncbi:MAG: hypothetical protein L6Q47_12120 [Ignavibacteriaceae bacterium]|nr:hypothetical protein [Ignavibacteriaceae bacterium]